MMSPNSSESNNSWLALAGGFEPPTHCLQGSCSAPELRQHRQNFTLVANAINVKDFLLLSLPGSLVAEDGGGGADIQGAHLAPHGDGQERIACSGDQRPHA